MKVYKELLDEVLEYGELRPSRVGDTYSLFGRSLLFNLQNGFPIVTSRKIHWRPVLGELAAFLRGASHVMDFKAWGCNYWDADAARWGRSGELGRIYGVQWREWTNSRGEVTDQLRNLVNGLTADPFGRRHIITAWNPGELADMALPPCHLLAQYRVSSTGLFLDCIVYMRSVDLCLGLPSDIVLYAALQHLVAVEIRLQPRNLTFMLGDAHIYANHALQWQQVQSAVPMQQLPIWHLKHGGLFDFDPTAVDLIRYTHGPALQYKLNT